MLLRWRLHLLLRALGVQALEERYFSRKATKLRTWLSKLEIHIYSKVVRNIFAISHPSFGWFFELDFFEPEFLCLNFWSWNFVPEFWSWIFVPEFLVLNFLCLKLLGLIFCGWILLSRIPEEAMLGWEWENQFCRVNRKYRGIESLVRINAFIEINFSMITSFAQLEIYVTYS